MSVLQPPPRQAPQKYGQQGFWTSLLTAVYLMFESLRRVKGGTGSPEGSVVGRVGDLYLRTDGAASTTLYVKESGADTNTGWIAK